MKLIQKKIWYLLLGAVMFLALLPLGTHQASAASTANPGVLRMQGIDDQYGIEGGGQNWVYLGDYNGSSIKWRVLSADKNGDSFQDSMNYAYTGRGLFLMSETSLGTSSFNSNTYSTEYQGSTLQTACGSLYESIFSDIEKRTILQTTKADSAITIADTKDIYGVEVSFGTSLLNQDRLFPLSAAEVVDSTYGFANLYYDDAREKDFFWWLRSPDTTPFWEGNIGNIGYNGEMGTATVHDVYHILPAFNLNLSCSYMASAAVGGKPSGAEGSDALVAIAEGSPTVWKLTLPDSGRHSFTTSISGTTTAAPGSKISVNYSSATTGPKEYVSAILMDYQLHPLYYGRIKNVTAESDANGSLSITVPSDLAGGHYNLWVFSEQYNGDYETDYASNFIVIPMTVDNTAPTVKTVTPSGFGKDINGSIMVTFSESMNSTAGTVSIDGGITALTGGGWSADNTVYTVSYTGLSYCKEYALTLSGFQDAAGNGMISNGATPTFTTMDVPGSKGTISGVVTDEDGSVPIPEADISVMVGEEEYYTLTAADGSFTIPDVPAGWYTVTAYKSGYTDSSVDAVRIAPDTTTSGINIIMESEEKGCLVTYRGAQKRYNSVSKTYDIRLIATIDTLNADKVGFVLSKTETLPITGNSSVLETTYVYTSITAMGSPVTAVSLNGTYIIAITVTEIPESDIGIPLYVRAFSTVNSVTKYTPVVTVIVNNLY